MLSDFLNLCELYVHIANTCNKICSLKFKLVPLLIIGLAQPSLVDCTFSAGLNNLLDYQTGCSG
jgi:hypothetical protein